MPWRAKGPVVSWANRLVGVPSCSASPCPAASPCAAPPRPARSMSGFWIRQVLEGVPGHALHDEGLQREKGVGTLVSGQERRAAVVPRINRGSTAGFVLPSVYKRIRMFVLPTTGSGQLFSMLQTAKGTLVHCANRPVGVPSCPAPPHSAALQFAAPPLTRPWYVPVLDSTGSSNMRGRVFRR